MRVRTRNCVSSPVVTPVSLSVNTGLQVDGEESDPALAELTELQLTFLPTKGAYD